MHIDFWKVYLVHNIVQSGRYFLFAGVTYLLFYVLCQNKWVDKKIQKRFPGNKQIKREIKDSLVFIFIFSLVFIFIAAAAKAGYAKFYKNYNYIGKWYFWLSIPLLVCWHDTWFYWIHRLMHLPKLFKIVHRQHHLSHNPAPWTAFAFHPIEAVGEAGFVFIVFILPVHPICLLIVITWQMLFNVYGHLGYELRPEKIHQSRPGRLFNTSTRHNMHHRLTKGNYGLYFNFWDSIMHTNHPDYENQYNKIAGKSNY